MAVLGLDIGGANLKAATSEGAALSVPFALWKTPETLSRELKELASRLPACSQIAVTMTGELADCFATKAEGVDQILNAVEDLAAGRPVGVWTTAGRFVPARAARPQWKLVAAANWHGLATWASRFAEQESAVLLDIGSTTTDIIPISADGPCTRGHTDLGRLLNGELVYTGVRRTPLCAVARTVSIDGTAWPLAAELFATTLDLYLLTGQIAESRDDCETADGRSATVECAQQRLCRTFCCDATELTTHQLLEIARQLIAAQQQQIRQALDHVLTSLPAPAKRLILSGSGAFAAHQVVNSMRVLESMTRIDLPRHLSPQIADSAAAFAVATLLAESQ